MECLFHTYGSSIWHPCYTCHLESPSPMRCQNGLEVVVHGISVLKTTLNPINQSIVWPCPKQCSSLFQYKPKYPCYSHLTHWGRVTHICVSKLTIIGSDNGLSPGRSQAIIWTNAGILLIGDLQTSHLSVYIRRNPFFNHFLRGISVFGYYPYFSVFCINCRLINRNPQLTLCSWTVPRTHAWAGTIVRPLPGELRPRGPIHVTPLGSIITNTATPLRNIESAQCRMRRHRIPV